MTTIFVRRGQGEDIPRIVEIWKQFFDFYGAAFWAKMGYRGFALQVCKDSGGNHE